MVDDSRKVAIYARVSSDRQDVDLSISAQLKAIREYASRNGHTVTREYVDEAESGRSIDRPGFKQMIAAARQKTHPFQAILVWKLSRFARNREDSIIYKSLLRKQGIQIVSINEPVEDTPSGRLLEGIIEVIDEFYSANLAQDVVRGMRETVSRGFFPGGHVPHGFRRVNVNDGETVRTKLETDPATAPVVRRIFNECISDRGLKGIATGLNRDGILTGRGKKWGTTSVHNVLKNEAYNGTLVWDRRKKRSIASGQSLPPLRCQGAWPPIVDPQTFELAQAKLASRAPRVTHPRTVHSEYILSGMIACEECKTALIGHAVKSGKFFYYMCGNARRKGRECCHTRLLPKDKIERFVVNKVKEHILTEQNLEDLMTLTNSELAQACSEEDSKLEILRSQIAEAESRLNRLYEALETGQFKGGELASRIKEVHNRLQVLRDAQASAENRRRCERVELPDPTVVQSYVRDLKGLLEKSSIVEQKAFLRSFVKKIVVGSSELKLIYTLPVLPEKSSVEKVGVLPFIQNGSPKKQS